MIFVLLSPPKIDSKWVWFQLVGSTLSLGTFLASSFHHNILILNMSLNNVLKSHEDNITIKMSTSTISSTSSIPTAKYDEEFTLMVKQPQLTNEDACLPLKLAQKYPSRIKDEVTKVIRYYESSLSTQLQQYHKLVQ